MFNSSLKTYYHKDIGLLLKTNHNLIATKLYFQKFFKRWYHKNAHKLPRLLFKVIKQNKKSSWQLQPPTTTTSLPSGRVGGDGCDVLNAANLHVGTCQSSQCWLSPGTGSLGLVATRSSQLDVQGCDTQALALLSYILQHTSTLVYNKHCDSLLAEPHSQVLSIN